MSEEQITMNKPEKIAKRVEAGKKLAEYNKAMRKKKGIGGNGRGTRTSRKQL